MPGDPQECRENAKRCLEMAQTSRTQAEREGFEGLALRWLALASDYDATNSLLANWGVAQHGSVAQTLSHRDNETLTVQPGAQTRDELERLCVESRAKHKAA
jgi:hypothetical protein